MKMGFQNILLWCLLAALVPCFLSAPLQANSDGGKKLSMWQKLRLRRDLCALHHLEDPAKHLPQQHTNDTEADTPQHSVQISERVRRSCKLITCVIHDLAERVNHAISRTHSAPIEKIEPHGYGRRRRRSLSQTPGEALLRLIRLQTRGGGSP